MKDIRGYSQELIRQIKTGEGLFRHDNLTNTKCPVCGKRMLAVKGKNTEMLVCQDRECRPPGGHFTHLQCQMPCLP